MTTSTNVEAFTGIAGSMVESAVDAVQQLAGTSVAVDDVESQARAVEVTL